MTEFDASEVTALIETMRQQEQQKLAAEQKKLQDAEAELRTTKAELREAALTSDNLRALLLQVSTDYSKKLAEVEQKHAKLGAQLAKVESEKNEATQQLAQEQLTNQHAVGKKVFVLTWTLSGNSHAEYFSTHQLANAAKAEVCASARSLNETVHSVITTQALDQRKNSNARD